MVITEENKLAPEPWFTPVFQHLMQCRPPVGTAGFQDRLVEISRPIGFTGLGEYIWRRKDEVIVAQIAKGWATTDVPEFAFLSQVARSDMALERIARDQFP